MDKHQALPPSPYKFLDSYTEEDRGIFFGRERETQILLSDVVVNRLVVLFAKTGTGKTSLINAGVRPLLNDRGYATFFIRVKRDPVQSAIEEINKHEPLLQIEAKHFADQLEGLAEKLDQPMVLFFDQFEDFFIYTCKEEGRKARTFVSDIARIYRNQESLIHIVFSMREEWFVDMDIFRDEIPNIYHKDSNLRLRWFDKDQAKEAIKLPAEAYGVAISEELIGKMIKDLSEDDAIEPTQLQILCDTLWREQEGETITLEHYRKLGQPGSQETIARQVLYQRLEEGFEQIDSKEQLDLLAILLPKLRLEDTKWVRDIVGLVEALETNDASLNELIEKLEQIRLIRKSKRDNLEVIELTHDYLAPYLDELQDRVTTIWPRRLLQIALKKYEESKEVIEPKELAVIFEKADKLTLDQKQAELLFRSALEYGPEAIFWFNVARSKEIKVWEIIKGRIDDKDKRPAVAAISLLAKIRSPEVISILEHALNHSQLSYYAIQAIVEGDTESAFQILEQALKRKDLTGYADDALRTLTHKALQGVAQALIDNDRQSARLSIHQLGQLKSPQALSILEQALSPTQLSLNVIEVLGQTETVSATRILEQALKQEGLIDQASTALRRLSESKILEVASQAKKVLSVFYTSKKLHTESEFSHPLDPPSPPNVTYSHRSRIIPYEAIAEALQGGHVVPFLGVGVNTGHRSPGDRWKSEVPFLPSSAELSRYLARMSAFPLEEDYHQTDLAKVASFFEENVGRGRLRKELHEIFGAADYPTCAIHNYLASIPELRLVITTNYDNLTEKAFAMAKRSFYLVIHTTSQDNHPDTQAKAPSSPSLSGQVLWWKYNPDNPTATFNPERGDPRDLARFIDIDNDTVIYKMHGTVSHPEKQWDNYVISEDDYVEFLARMTNETAVPNIVWEHLHFRQFLFLGYGLSDWNLRVVLREIFRKTRFGQNKSWAIQSKPSELEKELWAQRGVKIYDTDISEFVEGLKTV